VIALSVALVVVAALAHDAFRRRMSLEREAMEATKPVPPHEDLVAKVADLERRLGAISTWAEKR
jgi:hypothetical protein